ncbi:MAG: sensor histidine kinase, partial [Chloroflexi bacterium]
ITDCEAASVLLWNQKTRELFFAATTSDGANELIGKPVPLDSIAGQIVLENKVIQIDDAESDPRIYRKVGEEVQFVTRSLLGVPMTFQGRVIGAVEVLNKRTLPFTPDDVHYLQTLTSQAAVAIETAQLVMQLRRANEEMAELDELKNRFIAIASHELRTPLGVILGYASFLQEETSDEASEHASKVMASALQLRRIIEQMVNLRYLKQKQSELVLQPVAVSELIEAMYEDFITLANARNHKLDVRLPPPHIKVNVDPSRITMAFTNLLNNAVNFTPEGGIIEIFTELKGRREIWITVRDNGIGMTPEQLNRCFDEFYQAEDHMIRRYGGLGIGLSITKAVAEAHNGRIWAESEGPGKGTAFTIALPLAE